MPIKFLQVFVLARAHIHEAEGSIPSQLFDAGFPPARIPWRSGINPKA
jgi:hypothetical protein